MQKCGPGLIAGGLFLLTTVLLVFLVGIPAFIDKMLKQELQLREGTATWDKWVDVPIPAFMSMYVFHIKNPKAIENGEKFRLEEKGPYVYEEKRYKEILDVNEEEDTVTYKEILLFKYREDMSQGNKDTDLVSVINIPFITVSTILKKLLYGLANFPINYLQMRGESFVQENVSVRDLFFEGIDMSPYLDLLNLVPGILPPDFEGGKFAFYSTKNGVSTDIYTMKRGVKDHSRFGDIVAHNGRKEMPYWTDPDLGPYEKQYCNMINGSDGSIMQPHVTRDRKMYFFNMEVCRTIYAEYQMDTEFRGIPAYRFTLTKTPLESGLKNPENKCFCPKPGGGMPAHCDIEGVFRQYPCRFGAPLLLSLPHFYLGDERIVANLEGIKPEKEKHETFMDIEPLTGLMMNAKKRLQINLELEPLVGITAFRNVPSPYYVVPAFWAEEGAGLDDALTKEVKDMFIKPLKLIGIFQWVFVGLSIAIVFAGVIRTYIVHRRSRTT